MAFMSAPQKTNCPPGPCCKRIGTSTDYPGDPPVTDAFTHFAEIFRQSAFSLPFTPNLVKLFFSINLNNCPGRNSPLFPPRQFVNSLIGWGTGGFSPSEPFFTLPSHALKGIRNANISRSLFQRNNFFWQTGTFFSPPIPRRKSRSARIFLAPVPHSLLWVLDFRSSRMTLFAPVPHSLLWV